MIRKIFPFKLSLPVQLGLIIALSLLIGDFIPENFKSIAYAVSLGIKELLLFVLPVVIFSYVFACLLAFQQGQALFILVVMGAVCCSNFISTMIGYGVASVTVQHMEALASSVNESTVRLLPYWDFSLPQWVANDKALFAALGMGLLFSYWPLEGARRLAQNLQKLADFILQKLFLPVVPLFILGFILKMQFEGTLASILQDYAPVFGVVFVTQVSYIFLLYMIGAGFNLKKVGEFLRNLFPATMTAMSVMSSVAALPLAMHAAEKNTGEPQLARAILPSVVNIHLLGDSLAVPIMALAALVAFGHPWPTLESYLLFSGYFVLRKFSVAAVPGGGMFMLLDLFETHLGFTPDMLSLMTALYILFDSIGTAMNTLGNGAFTILLSKLCRKVLKSAGAPAEESKDVSSLSVVSSVKSL